MNAIFKTLLLLLTCCVLLSGCVTARYSNGNEQFKMTSVMKSVDGLSTSGWDGAFKMDIDATHSQDPVSNMLQMMQLMQGLQQFQAGVPITPPPEE